MIFKVCFSHYFDMAEKELNIDLDSDKKVVTDENNVVVGNISDFSELYNELMYDEKTCYCIEFFLLSEYYIIDFKLSDEQVYEILDGLNITDVRTP